MSESLSSRWTALVGLWSSASGFATFLVYAIGYLALRQYLTALGVEPGMSVVDERYLFAGLRVVLHLLLGLPPLLLLLALPTLVAWRLWKRLHGGRWFAKLSSPVFVATVGIVWTLGSIQLFMHQVLHFDHLLLRPSLPGPAWLDRVLLDDAGGLWHRFYLAGLVLAVAVAVGLLHASWRLGAPKGLVNILVLLVLIETMLLPINFGCFSAGRDVSRIAWPEAGGSPVGEAWLVWETDDDLALFTRQGELRRIVRVPKEDVAPLEILCADQLLRVLHAGESSRCGG